MILYLALLNYILLLFIKISLKSRMAVIPSFLFKKNWLNAGSIMPDLEMPKPMLGKQESIIEINDMPSIIMVVIGASVFAALVVFVCIFGVVYFFLKHKPHKEVEKRSTIYMREFIFK